MQALMILGSNWVSDSMKIMVQELVMFDPPFAYRGVDVRDQHSDMRLDVDNMSYEVTE